MSRGWIVSFQGPFVLVDSWSKKICYVRVFEKLSRLIILLGDGGRLNYEKKNLIMKFDIH